MIKRNKKSKMTIDKLAGMMRAGFGSTNKKIDNVLSLVDKLAASTLRGLYSIEEKMATKTDIEGLKNQLQGTNKRIDDLAENRVKYEDHDKLKMRVGVLEQKEK